VGVDFVYRQESPIVVLRELREALKQTETQLPVFLDRLQDTWKKTLRDFGERLDTTQRAVQALAQRVEAALRRLDRPSSPLPTAIADSAAWADEAVSYLERREAAGAANGCPLPELFAALRSRFPELTLVDFHSGLRRLHDHHAIHLLPFDGPPDRLPQPEYALPDGADLMYYARR
jgi:hypothetical protein